MPQLSEAVGTVHVTGLVLVLILAGQPLKTGDWLSITVTVCVQVLFFPFTSVAVHTTDVTPTGKEAGVLLVTEAIPQLSEVTGVPSATPEAEQSPFDAFTVTLEGQVITGF